jgi:hypothetical protein
MPQDRAAADDHLNELLFQLLLAEKNSLAVILGQFAVDVLKKHASDRSRRMMLINLAQAFKWQGKEDTAKVLTGKEDWTACGAEFQLAVAVLSDDFDTAAHIMQRLGPDDEAVSEADYGDWPLFKEFRKSDQFLQTYRTVYGKDFSSMRRVPVSLASHSANYKSAIVEARTLLMDEYTGPEYI